MHTLTPRCPRRPSGIRRIRRPRLVLPVVADSWRPAPVVEAVSLIGAVAVMLALAGVCWWAMSFGVAVPVVGF